MNVGFVEWDEEEGEYLVDFDKEDGGFLVEFCKDLVRGLDGGVSGRTIAFNIEDDAGRQDLVPSIDHPDNPSRIDFSEQWKGDVREARDAAERVDES
jgi:hypothetical protein